jgi:hypothetical protein
MAILAAVRRRRTHKREAPMMAIDRGEQSTVSTNHRLAIVVMVSAGLLSCGTSPPLAARDVIHAPKPEANHVLRTQRLRMDSHQADAAEQAARRSARK